MNILILYHHHYCQFPNTKISINEEKTASNFNSPFVSKPKNMGPLFLLFDFSPIKSFLKKIWDGLKEGGGAVRGFGDNPEKIG